MDAIVMALIAVCVAVAAIFVEGFFTITVYRRSDKENVKRIAKEIIEEATPKIKAMINEIIDDTTEQINCQLTEFVGVLDDMKMQALKDIDDRIVEIVKSMPELVGLGVNETKKQLLETLNTEEGQAILKAVGVNIMAGAMQGMQHMQAQGEGGAMPDLNNLDINGLISQVIGSKLQGLFSPNPMSGTGSGSGGGKLFG